MKENYIWEINVKNTPLLKRKCSHCNSDRFYCSKKFRMNSQKRNIDVWLIYKCVKCDKTYNLPILTRTKPELIHKSLFDKFSENSETLARAYAFSSEAIGCSNVELDYSSVEYGISHDSISVEDMLNNHNETVAFKIKTEFSLNIKLPTIIRKCLKLSARQLDMLIEAKAISITENGSIKKRKLKDGDIIQVDKKKLADIVRTAKW